MTSLIKFDTAAGRDRIRALDLGGGAGDAMAVVQEDPVIAALKAEVTELHQVIGDLNATHVAAIAAAREESRKAAEEAFVHDEAKALAALKEGIREAKASLQDHLDAAEKFAIVFSAAALEKVIGDTSKYQSLITECMRLQVEGLRRDTILNVRVSASDFSDQNAIDALASELELGCEGIALDPLLPAGQCRIELRLGAIDITLPEHWSALQALCRRLVNGGLAP